jgi:hypothetical protein
VIGLQPPGPVAGRARSGLRSLRHRDYRLFFLGQSDPPRGGRPGCRGLSVSHRPWPRVTPDSGTLDSRRLAGQGRRGCRGARGRDGLAMTGGSSVEELGTAMRRTQVGANSSVGSVGATVRTPAAAAPEICREAVSLAPIGPWRATTSRRRCSGDSSSRSPARPPPGPPRFRPRPTIRAIRRRKGSIGASRGTVSRSSRSRR